MDFKCMFQRIACAGIGLALSLGTAHAANAADAYPARPVSIVVPYPAGGATDVVARLVAAKVSEEWKQTILIDNRPGASGMIGATSVARSKPDGYTLLLTITALVQAPALYKEVQYDPLKDFVPLTLLARAMPTLVVRGDMPATTVKEYAELTKSDPGKWGAIGNYGTGSMSHVYAALLDRQAGLGLTHVAYKGAAQLTTDLLGGQVAAGMNDINTALPHLQTGKLKVLAVTGADRSPLLPDVPSLTELGYKDFEAYGWIGLFAPAGTPSEIVQKVSNDFARALERDDVREALRAAGIVAEQGGSQEAFQAMIHRDTELWARLIKAANIEPQ